MNPFKALLYIISWLPLFVINFALLLVGIPLVALFAGLEQKDWPRWTWLWQNEEDAGAPGWYGKRFPDGSPWLMLRLGENMGGFDPDTLIGFRHNKWVRQWKYSAFRNPVNNHRFIFEDRVKFKTAGDPNAFNYDGKSLRAAGLRSSSGWRWAGFFAGYKRTWLNKTPGYYSEFYIGWKVGSATPGLGFTLQTRFNRPYIKVY